MAERSYGPTNPGDAVYENDPGVIGALYLDPNTAIHATGRSFVDRAYVGKIQASYRLPPANSVVGFVELGAGSPKRRFASASDAAETDVVTNERRVRLWTTLYYYSAVSLTRGILLQAS